jgi:oxygen-dependent protoporphyrinogen oxidase
MRIAIIGGGIAGLAAAYELEKARAAGAPLSYTLFEARERLGGSLSSEIVNGAVIERGPDSFLSEKPAAAELCRELGLGAELLPSNDADRKTYIVVRNRLVPLPDGLMFLVPTKLVPTALTRLFSLSTKIRMGMELLIPPRPSGLADESVADLVKRHFGAEAVDRLADPLLSGIYGGDATALSARTVLPRMVEMETKYGSLTRGMLAAHRKMRAMAAAPGKAGTNGSPPRPIFTALRRTAAIGGRAYGPDRSRVSPRGHCCDLAPQRPGRLDGCNRRRIRTLRRNCLRLAGLGCGCTAGPG